MLGLVNEVGETTKLSGQTLGKIYNQLINNQEIYKERGLPFLCKWKRRTRQEPSSRKDGVTLCDPAAGAVHSCIAYVNHEKSGD